MIDILGFHIETELIRPLPELPAKILRSCPDLFATRRRQ
jgi:hypothetical protein